MVRLAVHPLAGTFDSEIVGSSKWTRLSSNTTSDDIAFSGGQAGAESGFAMSVRIFSSSAVVSTQQRARMTAAVPTVLIYPKTYKLERSGEAYSKKVK